MSEISPALGLMLMLNNYLHDIATGLLAASGVALWVMLRDFSGKPGDEASEYFLRMYRTMTNLAKFSLIWILIGGIPRTLFYRNFEWANAVEHAQVQALMVQHILGFILVAFGCVTWSRLNKRIKGMGLL